MSDWKPQERAAKPGAPPGWGTAFPPEKPRRDAPAGTPASQGPAVTPYQSAPYSAAPPAAPAPTPAPTHSAPGVSPLYGTQPVYGPNTLDAVAMPGVPLSILPADPMTESRSHLDGKRVLAAIIDWLLMAGGIVAAWRLIHHWTLSTYFLTLACCVIYLFVSEVLFGQTLGKRWMGLRVVKRDGSSAGAAAIAARNVIGVWEVLSAPLIGYLVMVFSGPRRQRIGDLAAGTIVREDYHSWRPAPSSPLVVIYPVLWASAALFFGAMMGSSSAHLSSDPYMQQINAICRNAGASRPIGLEHAELQVAQVLRGVEALPPPPNPTAVHGRRVVLKWFRRVDRILTQIIADTRASGGGPMTVAGDLLQLRTVVQKARTATHELGLPNC